MILPLLHSKISHVKLLEHCVNQDNNMHRATVCWHDELCRGVSVNVNEHGEVFKLPGMLEY